MRLPLRTPEIQNVQNYFNYYTEIEERFQQRRGTILMLSTLDWSLIATWQEAGFPLEAVLAGIDATFEKYESRKARGRLRSVNSLAYCAQEVLRAVEDMHEAAVGTGKKPPGSGQETGFENLRIAAYLQGIAARVERVDSPAEARPIFSEAASELVEISRSLAPENGSPKPLEAIERQLLSIEDRIFAALQMFTPAQETALLREQSARELAPYRSRLNTTQIRQIEQQFLRRSLFEKAAIPRLSLFHMRPA
jgi:hypothetical protein